MKFNNKYIAIIAILAILAIVGVYKSPTNKAISPTQNTIKIGGISALTGVGVAIGQEERKGALLAIEEVNARGGVLGHDLELISEDVSIDKIKSGVSVVRKLIDVDKVVAIVGPQWDEPAAPILPIIEESKVPMVGADSSPMLKAEHDYKYFFSTWYDNRVGIRELLRFAQSRGLKNITIVKPIAAGFWEYTASIFKKEAPNFGVKIVDEINIGDPLLLDFKTTILKVKEKNPDAVFVVTSDYNQCIFLKQSDQVGYHGVSLGTESSGDPTSLSQCPKLLENRYFSTPVQTDRYKEFAERFKNRFGDYPRFPSAGTAYDAVMVIAHSLEVSELQGGAVLRDAIEKIKDFKGVSLQSISFNNIGFVDTPEDSFEINTVRDAKFVGVEY